MNKNFETWHAKKAALNAIVERPFFHEREIWYCHLGTNIGFEQDGKGPEGLRPAVIVRKFGNGTLWAIPLTHTQKEGIFYHRFSFEGSSDSVAILSQLRMIDARRLSHKIGYVGDGDFKVLIQKTKDLFP